MEELIKVLQETNALLSEFFHDNTMEFLALAVSVVAAIAAVYVPWKISNRQDKVALFEKRFEAYSDLCKMKNFADLMRDSGCSFWEEDLKDEDGSVSRKHAQRCNMLILQFSTIWGEFPKAMGTAECVQSVTAQIKRVEASVNALPLLYSKVLSSRTAEMQKELTEIFEMLLALMAIVAGQTEQLDDRFRTEYVQKMDAFMKKYSEIFEAELKL